MVKSVSVVSRKSVKKDNIYTCIEVDIGYKKVKLFADNGVYQTLTNLNPLEFSNLLVDEPCIVDCKTISLKKAHSAKKDVDYMYLEFDVGFTKVSVFTDNFTYCDLFDITPKTFYNIQINEPIVLKVGE